MPSSPTRSSETPSAGEHRYPYQKVHGTCGRAGRHRPRRLVAEADRVGSFRRRIPVQDHAQIPLFVLTARTDRVLAQTQPNPLYVSTIRRSRRFVAAGRSIARLLKYCVNRRAGPSSSQWAHLPFARSRSGSTTSPASSRDLVSRTTSSRRASWRRRSDFRIGLADSESSSGVDVPLATMGHSAQSPGSRAQIGTHHGWVQAPAVARRVSHLGGSAVKRGHAAQGRVKVGGLPRLGASSIISGHDNDTHHRSKQAPGL